jgi:signal transduction histidine kinase
MIQTLRWKFVAVIMAIVTVILGTVFGVSYFTTWNDLQTTTTETLLQAVMEPERVFRPGNENGRTRLSTVVIEMDAQGTVMRVAGDLRTEELDDWQAVADAVRTQGKETGTLTAYSLRYYCLPLSTGGWRVACADWSFASGICRSLLRNMAAIVVAALAVFFLLSLGLSIWMTRPVERAWERQRQFVADASHELKTPLTVILSSADMLASKEEGMDEDSRRWTEHIQAEAAQMRRLVEELLSLARADAEEKKTELVPVDLSDVVESSVLTFEPIVYERGRRMESQIQPDCQVMGNEAQLRQVVDILLDNGSKYALADGEINVELRNEGKYVLLRVSNPSEPIPDEVLERLFDRFYRMDRARSGYTGYGLGLAIAQKLVTSFRGRIWAEHRNGVTVMQVRLPILAKKGD